MKVGMISFAHGHANAYASSLVGIDGVTLVGIADEHKERGGEAARKYKTTYYNSYRELLNQGLDAVIVTSENAHHKEHAIAAARAGAAVLCEKPLAHTVKDAEELIVACEEAGVLLQTAFPVRFNEAIKRAKARIDAGEFGEIIAVKGTNRGKNPGGWFNDKQLAGGGAVIDHTVHVVDIMRWILKEEVKDVYAEIDQHFSSNDIDDAGVLSFTFENNVFATLDCSWSRNANFPTWGDVTLEFIGTEGTLKVDAQAQKLDVFHSGGLKYDFWGDNMDDSLVRNFIENVREKRQPSVTGRDGLKALEVAIGAYASAAKGEVIALRGNERERVSP